jgi:creatinine amidohydrolase
MMRSGYWHDLTTTDFAGLDPERTVALLPVSATEQHGPHLPLSTDAVINEAVVRGALAQVPATAVLLVLPPVPIGDSLEHTAFRGTLSARLESLLGLWLDIGAGVARAGVRKLVLFNTHGGQQAHVDLVAVRLRAAHRMLVVRANSSRLGKPAGLFDAEELAHGLHGGQLETSLMLHLRPDLVRRAELRDFASLGGRLAARGGQFGVERAVGFGWMSQDVNAEGVCGNAAAASAQLGEALLQFLSARLAALVAEVADVPLSILADGPLDAAAPAGAAGG